jgi:hypothetical protein
LTCEPVQKETNLTFPLTINGIVSTAGNMVILPQFGFHSYVLEYEGELRKALCLPHTFVCQLLFFLLLVPFHHHIHNMVYI